MMFMKVNVVKTLYPGISLLKVTKELPEFRTSYTDDILCSAYLHDLQVLYLNVSSMHVFCNVVAI